MKIREDNYKRLCAKQYNKQQAIEILITKSTAGYRPANMVCEAQELAGYGLRARQIHLLTSLPDINCTRLVENAGITSNRGRTKTGMKGFMATAMNQARTSNFLNAIEHQMRVTESSVLVSKHVLAAIKATLASAPRQSGDFDWQRMVQAAFELVAGNIRLTNCCLCGTRHLARTPAGKADRSCPLCRVAESMTVCNKGADQVTRIVRGERPVIPGEVSDPVDRRVRVRVALGL
jgi:hypothetical protein